MQIGVTAQNGDQLIRLPNDLLYPRIEVEQRTHSGDEIADILISKAQICIHLQRAFGFLPK